MKISLFFGGVRLIIRKRTIEAHVRYIQYTNSNTKKLGAYSVIREDFKKKQEIFEKNKTDLLSILSLLNAQNSLKFTIVFYPM